MSDYTPYGSFDECFRELTAADADSDRARLLTYLYKTFDLRDPAHSDAVRIISEWINSPDDELRIAVANALCLFRPVRGYEWVAIVGWQKSSPFDLHWYAAALENAFVDVSLLTPQVAGTVAERLFVRRPERHQFSDDFAFEQALQTHDITIREGHRACRHFWQLLTQPPASRGELAPSAVGDAKEVDWKIIAYVLYRACCGLEKTGSS